MRTIFKVTDVDTDRVICETVDGENQEYLVNDSLKSFRRGDVVELMENGQLKILHDASQCSGCLYITNKCNSNCIMCPDSVKVRQLPMQQDFDFLKQYLLLLPTDLPFLDITGGEPTLLKGRLSDIIQLAVTHFEFVHIMMLTNGRAFADRTYAQTFEQFNRENMTIEIPIHGSEAKLHNRIAGSVGSFSQTEAGIKNLLSHRLNLSIRVVVSKLNYRDLEQIIHYIGVNFPQIRNLNLMGLEMLGNALHNKGQVWIEFEELKIILQSAASLCFSYGIEPQFYNFPLCMFDERYWSIYRKSISEYKVVYLDDCRNCKLQSYCGGFFASTANITNFQGKAAYTVHE